MTPTTWTLLALAAAAAAAAAALLADRHLGGFCFGRTDATTRAGRTTTTCRKCGTVWITGRRAEAPAGKEPR